MHAICPTKPLLSNGVTPPPNIYAPALTPRQNRKCVHFIANFLSRKKVTLKELQSLLGLLNFACAVVTPGRAFLRRLIDLTRGISHPHFFIRLMRNVKNDLRVWQEFLCSFNGKSLLKIFWMITGATIINLIYLRTHLAPLVSAPYSGVTGAMGNGRMSGGVIILLY